MTPQNLSSTFFQASSVEHEHSYLCLLFFIKNFFFSRYKSGYCQKRSSFQATFITASSALFDPFLLSILTPSRIAEHYCNSLGIISLENYLPALLSMIWFGPNVLVSPVYTKQARHQVLKFQKSMVLIEISMDGESM